MDIDLAHAHRQFPAVAEYLSSIYILLRDYGYVSNTRLAEWTGVSGSAVTQALSRLKRLGLVRQKRYENVLLTEDGRTLAVKVLRRHYLIEHLLVAVLGYPWDKADEEAKLLQSQISDDLTEHLYQRLGSPQTCPHGNPMPGAAIEAKLLAAAKLSEAPEGHVALILRITEEGEQIPEMLSFCYSNGIQPGRRFTVRRADDEHLGLSAAARSDDVEKRGEILLATALAEHIRYENG